MQSSRERRILRALSMARRDMTASEIHEAIGGECSKRTTYRALNNLVADNPLHRIEGRGNEPDRWRLQAVEPGSATMPLGPMQILALAVAEDLLSPLRGTFLEQPLASLRGELRAALTPKARAWADELRRSVAASHIGPARYGHSEVFAAIEEALAKEHLLWLEHGKSRKTSRRFRFAPYATWVVPGRTYLVGRLENERFERQLAVHRIHRAEVLDEPFERDPSFDMTAFTRHSFGVFRGPVHDIVIDFSAEVAHVAHERLLHESQRVTARPDGGARLCMRCAGLPEIAAWLAGFGGLARPVAPDELVDAVQAIHRRGLGLPEPPGPDLAKTRPTASRKKRHG